MGAKVNINKDKLYELYILDNKRVSEVAEYFNCSKSVISKNLKKYGIIKSSELIQENIKQTNIKRYGVVNTFLSNDVKEKIKKTNLEKYGVENPFESEEIKNKIKKTNIKKYGVENPSQSKEIRNKVKKTNISRYGVECPLQNEEIKEKSELTLLNKYGTTNIMESDEIKNKIISINKEKYGTDWALSSPEIREKIKRTNILKYGVPGPNVKHDTEIIFKDRETARNYFEQNFNGLHIDEISDMIGYSKSQLCKYARKYDLYDFIVVDRSTSKYEPELIEFIKQIGVSNFEIHNIDIMNGEEIDIYIPELNIGIEFNGSYWHSEAKKEKRYHINKSLLAGSKGIFIYHIFEYEWINNKDKIKNQLKNLLKQNNNKIYARKCKIVNVSKKDKSKFLNENHIQGNDKSSIEIGLEYNGELVSIMTFTKPRFTKSQFSKCTWELSRYCSKSDTNILGGASKLFKYFVNNYLDDDGSIISYSDIAKTKGTLYSTLGFRLDHISEPNYIWWRQNYDYLSRYQTQMKDEVKTMHDYKYYRIYDCGNKVWIYNKRRG